MGRSVKFEAVMGNGCLSRSLVSAMAACFRYRWATLPAYVLGIESLRVPAFSLYLPAAGCSDA